MLMIHHLLIVAIGLFVGAAAAGAAPPAPPAPPEPAEPAGVEFFEKRVRPVLVEHCYKCHSDKTKEPKGGLRVDSRAALLEGGDSGTALEPGQQVVVSGGVELQAALEDLQGQAQAKQK